MVWYPPPFLEMKLEDRKREEKKKKKGRERERESVVDTIRYHGLLAPACVFAFARLSDRVTAEEWYG